MLQAGSSYDLHSYAKGKRATCVLTIETVETKEIIEMPKLTKDQIWAVKGGVKAAGLTMREAAERIGLSYGTLSGVLAGAQVSPERIELILSLAELPPLPPEEAATVPPAPAADLVERGQPAGASSSEDDRHIFESLRADCHRVEAECQRLKADYQRLKERVAALISEVQLMGSNEVTSPEPNPVTPFELAEKLKLEARRLLVFEPGGLLLRAAFQMAIAEGPL